MVAFGIASAERATAGMLHFDSRPGKISAASRGFWEMRQ